MSHLKRLIGDRVKELRGEVSQEAIEAASGVDRGIISAIERGTTDYRIESLLKVFHAVKADAVEAIFAKDPLEKTLHDSVSEIYRAGIPSETHFLMDALNRAKIGIEQARSRSPALKSKRSA